MLYRFCLNREDLLSCADDVIDDPVQINETFWTGRGDRPGFEVCDRIWGGGRYEIKIHFYAKRTGSSTTEIDSMVFTIDPGDLMYVRKIHDVFEWNFWGNNWSAFTIAPEDVEPKWYYPGEHDRFMCVYYPWTLSENSSNIVVFIEEVDHGETQQVQKTTTFKYSTTTSISTEIGNDVVKTQLGSSITVESSESCTITLSWKDESDDLGTTTVDYCDNVVTNYNEESDKYSLKRYDTGRFSFSLLPVDVRNEYNIRNYMTKRN